MTTTKTTSIKTRTPYIGAIVLLAAAVLFAGPSARADQPAKAMRVVFAYASSDSAAYIYEKLEQTARKACTGLGNPAAVAGQTVRGCITDLMDAAMRVMERPDVTELHRMKHS